MERTRQITIQFTITWTCVFLLSAFAMLLKVSEIDIKSFAIIAASIAFIQVCIIGFKKSSSVFILPSAVLMFQIVLTTGIDPMGDGREAAMTLTQLVSPYFDKGAMTIVENSSVSPAMRKGIILLNCTLFSWLYLFMELLLVKFILIKCRLCSS